MAAEGKAIRTPVQETVKQVFVIADITVEAITYSVQILAHASPRFQGSKCPSAFANVRALVSKQPGPHRDVCLHMFRWPRH